MNPLPRVKWPDPFPGAYWLDDREDRAVLDVLHRRSLFRYYGLKKPRHASRLEATARRLYGVRYALGVNSGTGALMTAMNAMRIGPGCEVILPAFFWVATVGAVVAANAIPVLCEVDDTFNLDPADFERKITARTKLIVAVHMAGGVCDMPAIMKIANRHHIPVLEDCAQANGATCHGRMVGTFGKVGVFSLQWNKNATAGEGGFLITNDSKLYERMVAAHDLGIPWVKGAPQETGPDSVTWGGGRRMSELTGAVAAVQLSKLARILGHMRASKRRMKTALTGLPGLSFRRLTDERGDAGGFMILVLETERLARRLLPLMQSAGLRSACRVAEYGLHIYSNIPQLVRQVPLSPAGNPWNLPANRASRRDYRRGTCPRSDALFARSILLPIPSRLTLRQEAAAVRIIKAALLRV